MRTFLQSREELVEFVGEVGPLVGDSLERVSLEVEKSSPRGVRLLESLQTAAGNQFTFHIVI